MDRNVRQELREMVARATLRGGVPARIYIERNELLALVRGYPQVFDHRYGALVTDPKLARQRIEHVLFEGTPLVVMDVLGRDAQSTQRAGGFSQYYRARDWAEGYRS